ncbi:MAG: PilZ domain-containing protein [Acidobacteriia bacterium]|nr:PilZ domain-containing protein [Terriglobia bacterium]
MTEEMNEGSAYLRALKQATGSHPGADAAPEPDRLIDNLSTVQGSESFQGAEKRRSPRYKCEGSVQLREEGCDVRTWSTFTDISLNGCYVEAQATYPAGTSLHMKLEASGIRVETKGKVRISYPYLGMGIAFEEMSEENVTHLKQLLASLSRPALIMGPGATSPHPTTGPMEALPAITHPEAAVRAVVEFFEIHQLLMRDDFVKLLRKSQQ